MAEMSVDYYLQIGQRVTLCSKQSGILRYKGLVSFSPGIWCGIEFDEAVGDNDGSIDNVRYFSCKRNHGHFCHFSEILRKPFLSETDLDISKCTTFEDSELSISPNITEVGEKIETFSLIESSDDPLSDSDSLGIMDLDAMDLDAKSSEDDFYILGHATQSSAEQEKLNVTQVISSPEETSWSCTQIDSSEKQRSSNVIQTTGWTDESFDSDTMLVFNRTIEVENKLCFDEHSGSRIMHPLITSLPDSKSGESPYILGHATQSSAEQEKLNVTQVISSPEEANWSCIQIDSSKKQCSSNIIQTTDWTDKSFDSDTRLVFNRTIEMEKKRFDEHSGSYMHPLIASLPDSKSGESPFHKTESSPKYASTPKHEVNYTFNLDDNQSSEHNFSPVSHMDKTIVKYDAVKGKTVFPEGIEPDHDYTLPRETYIKLSCDTDRKNIVNLTCATEKLIDYHHELNKTTVFSHNVEPDHDNILSNEKCMKFPDDEKNILNVALSTEEQLHELNKTFTNFPLNTTMSVSEGPEKTFEECLNETQTLNTTYEKKDQLSVLSEIKKVSKVNKQHEVRETKNTQESKIVKDRKKPDINNLKSMCHFYVPSKCEVKYKSVKIRRKTFGSISSLSDDIALSQSQKLSNFDQKENDAYCGAISNTTANLVRSPKNIACDKSEKHLIKEGIGVESRKTEHKPVKSAAKVSLSIPKPLSRQTGKYKSSLQKEQKFSLNETINITESTSVTERRAFDKSNVPSKRHSVAKCEISKISRISSSLMPRPCSSKIKESIFEDEVSKTLKKKSTVQEEQKMSDEFHRKLNQPLTHEHFEISPLMSSSSSIHTVDASQIMGEREILSTIKLHESAPDTEGRASEKSEVPSKRLSVSKYESKFSITSSSLVPRLSSSKIKKSKSTVLKEENISCSETKKPIESELNTRKSFEKPKKLPVKFTGMKHEIPKAIGTDIPRAIKCELSGAVSTGKSSLPVRKKEIIHQSGYQEKRVLFPSNKHGIRSGPGLSCTFAVSPKITRMQSLGSNTSESEAATSQNLTAGRFPQTIQSNAPLSSVSRKKKHDDTATSQNLAAVRLPRIVQSNIPLSSASRKKKDDENVKVLPISDNKKRYNLR